MHISRFFSVAISCLGLCLAACTNSDGLRGCLGGAEVCDPGTVITQNNNNTTVQSSSSNNSGNNSGSSNSSSNGNQTVITENASSTFACSAVPFPAMVYPYQNVQVTVSTTGGTPGDKTITNFAGYTAPTFAEWTSLFGWYDANRAGTVVTRTIQVQSSSGELANCNFSVTVLNPNAGWYSPLNCQLSIDESAVRVGDTAHFTLRAYNAGNAFFTRFQPTGSQTADDSAITHISGTQSVVAVKYLTEGLKTATVRLSDGNRSAHCSLTFAVGPTNLQLKQWPPGPTRTDGLFTVAAQAMGITSTVGITYAFSSTDSRAQILQTGPNTARVKTTDTTDHTIEVKAVATGHGGGTWTNTVPLRFEAAPTANTALTGCSVSVASVGTWSEFSSAVPMSSLARIRATPQGGVGPFTLSIVSITQAGVGGAPFGYNLHSGATDTQTQNVVFNQTGTPLVTVMLTDGKTGQSAQCSTYAVVQ